MDALTLSRRDGDTHEKPLLALERRSIPVADDGQVLIRVRASKLNPSDALNVNGGFPYTTYPRIPGRDYAGIVLNAPNRPALVGQSVFGTSGSLLGFTNDGSQAEYMLLNADCCIPMPSSLDFETAASIGVVYSTALLMLKRAHLQDYQSLSPSVLIIGQSGNVGGALGRLIAAKYPDVTVSAANRKDGRFNLALKSQFDVIFSTVPSTAALQDVLNSNILAKGAKLVFIATTRPKSEKLQVDPMQFYRQDLSLIGVNSINSTMEEAQADLREIAKLIEMGRLAIPKQDYQGVKLVDAVDAYTAYGTRNENVIIVMPA